MKKTFKYIDKPLLIITVILFIIGLIMVFSSSNVTAYMQYAASPYHYFINQGIFLLLGIVGFAIMMKFNTKLYGLVSWILLIGLISSLIALLIVGKAKNSAISWFDFGPFSFQPSEFIKVVSIIWLAYYYEDKKDRLSSIWVSAFPIAVCVIIAGLIFLQPDLGTTIIYTVIVGTLFLSEPIKPLMKFKIVVATFAVVGIILGGMTLFGKDVIHSRQSQRIKYYRPCDRLLSDGNQVCNGYIAINNGGLWGKGLGNSTQKYLYLPEPYTDFIFTIIMEELGSVVGVLILLMYMFILVRILMIGRNSYTNRGCAMCYGVAVYIFCHIAVNLTGIFGILPMTGVPLPFMSYGGSFTICLIGALTVVQRVNLETKIRDELDQKNQFRKKLKKA